MYEGPLRTNVKSVKTSILVLKVIQGHWRTDGRTDRIAMAKTRYSSSCCRA